MRKISNDRLGSGIGVVLIHGLLGYALLMGLLSRRAPQPADQTALIDIPNPPPPPREREQPRPRKITPHAGGSPHAREAPPRVISAPQVIPHIAPPPVPVAANGVQGVSDRPGNADAGEGNGEGNGSGSGYGSGDGDGFPPRQIAGRLKFSDYPRNAVSAGVGGTVGVRYRVNVDGHVSNCVVTSSSGDADLDATTCRLIEQRFRFEPARDEDRRPVPSQIVESHTWEIQRDPDYRR